MPEPADYRPSRIAYWITTGIVAALFAGPGIANLVRVDHIALDMARLGYPPYIMTLLGLWKLLAVVAILSPRLPRLKEWAYAGMIFDLTGAAFSRAAIHDGLLTIVIPLAIAALALTSWALRPPARKLGTSDF